MKTTKKLPLNYCVSIIAVKGKGVRCMPKINKIRTDVLNAIEVAHMIDKSPTPEIRCMVALLYNYGMRVTEMIEIKIGDIRIKNDYLYIRTKTLKARAKVIPEKRTLKRHLSNPFMNYILEHYNSVINSNQVWLFPSPYNIGSHITRKTVLNIVTRLDPTVWCHLFRHTRATIFGEENATESQLVAWFGWADSRPAQRYVRKSERLIQTLADLDR